MSKYSSVANAQAKNVFMRTRYAPTPSGFLHLGNAFSFALTAALAAKYGAKILLRIDDLDKERCRPEYVRDVFETLQFLDLPWHEGPQDANGFYAHFSQELRVDNHNALLERLWNADALFACVCSRADMQKAGSTQCVRACAEKRLPRDTQDCSWRLRANGAGNVSVNTLDGCFSFPFPEDMRQVVLRKKDGRPAYQIASLADDLHFQVDLVVRGKDLWNSTLVQLYLAQLLGETAFGATTFVHHDLLLLPDGAKLSKSAGDTSIAALRRQGKSREEVFALLGDHLRSKKTLRSFEDFTSFFGK